MATIRPALSTALAGHLLVLGATAAGWLGRTPATAAALACSILAVVGLAERGRRGALIAGHGVAAALVLAGFAPGLPAALALAGMVGAAAMGVAGLVTLGAELPPSRPLTLAPRVAAIALLVPALVQPWAASATGLAMRLRAAIFVGLAGLGVALLASVAVVALRARRGWVIAGLAAWMIGWVASTADLGAAIAAGLGASAPIGPHQLRELDAALVQLLATAGGVAIGAAIASSFEEPRTRHSAIVLIVGYAVFGLLVARAEHGIALATDFPGLVAQREQRNLAEALRSFALAGVMWQCWRRGPRAGA